MPSPVDDWINPAVQGALVAAFVAMGGWIYNGRQNRRMASQLRAERVNDLQRAILAEIRAHVVSLEHQQLSLKESHALIERVRAGGYIPSIPSEANDRIFRAVIAEIHVLPALVIDPVVIYYRLLAVMEALAADVQNAARKDALRAADMLTDYLLLSEEALEAGRYAMVILSAQLNGGVAAIEALLDEASEAEAARITASLPGELVELRERLNKRSSDRSDL
ncbi:hypothetical protein [Paracoccus aminophilus]|uniref:Uncharacterized protein n=1 Tax=Paracoccus aminophilus JCM 7686 TaxID=1367847 RepID=S5YUY8_PARAH|nr:hypothetical protein [Paracoccus aminophilus]AGT09011.1 hypothetical protein JCM7686_1910 [Paracoccus aminophilus JCM 7686]